MTDDRTLIGVIDDTAYLLARKALHHDEDPVAFVEAVAQQAVAKLRRPASTPYRATGTYRTAEHEGHFVLVAPDGTVVPGCEFGGQDTALVAASAMNASRRGDTPARTEAIA